MKPFLRKIIIVAALLALWQAAAVYVNVDILLPSPAAVIGSLWKLLIQKDFYITVLLSLFRVLAGFVLGVALGVICAGLSVLSEWVKDTVGIIVSIFKAAPVASFIILALVWLQKGRVPVFASFLIVMPLVFLNVYTGIRQTPRDLIEMSRAFGVKRKSMLTKLYVPAIMPYFVSASTTAMGMAWKAGIAAEIIASPKYSIGSYMNSSKIYLNTPDLFAWTIVVILLSMALEKLLGMKKRKGGGTYDTA